MRKLILVIFLSLISSNAYAVKGKDLANSCTHFEAYSLYPAKEHEAAANLCMGYLAAVRDMIDQLADEQKSCPQSLLKSGKNMDDILKEWITHFKSNLISHPDWAEKPATEGLLTMFKVNYPCEPGNIN